jgi:hypothetical protein
MLAIADDVIDQSANLPHRICRLMAQRYRQRRIEFTVGIGGTADIEWPRRLDQFVESDPSLPSAAKFCCDAQRGITM